MAKNGEGLGTHVRWTQGGRKEGRVGEEVPNYKCVRPGCESEFLTIYMEYSSLCECLRSCLAVEHSMMKSGVLLECEPYIDLVSI